VAGGVVEVGERKARLTLPGRVAGIPQKNIGKSENMVLKRGLTNQK